MSSMKRAGALLLLAAGCAAPRPSFHDGTIAAIWVTRWDYHSLADVRTAIANGADLGVTDVLWQCRGAADAYYPSALEPWGAAFDGDPLALAIEEAHARGLRLHAWINVMPVWHGTATPGPESIAGRHPDWVVVRRDGTPQAPNTHYLCGNPANDAWVAHVAAVARDLVTRYDLDGLHLDYIRYLEGDFAPADPDAKRELVTNVVARIREATRGTLLTAAVYPTAPRRRGVFQDAERWVREGLIDGVFPMQYREKNEDFEPMVRDSRECFGAKAYNGIGLGPHRTAERTVEQIAIVRASGARGFALFSYHYFFNPGVDAALRAARVAAVKEALHAHR